MSCIQQPSRAWGGGNTSLEQHSRRGKVEDLPGEWRRKGCTAKVWSAGHKMEHGSPGFGPGTSARSRRNVTLQSSAHRRGLPRGTEFSPSEQLLLPTSLPTSSSCRPSTTGSHGPRSSQSTALQEHLQGTPAPSYGQTSPGAPLLLIDSPATRQQATPAGFTEPPL